jgi:hypothetical protein
MKSETRNKLQAILDGYKQRQAEILRRYEQSGNERKAFLEAFFAKVNDTIRPCFEELGAMVKARGHGFEIMQKNESVDAQGQVHSAYVKIEILPNGFRAKAGERPTISFIADSARREVWTEVSTIMSICAGQRNVYALDEITGDVVEEEVLSVLASCFG